ncbi:MAG: hypothetical protein MET45_08760 [Nostoc sp. LLA-1]|nr:hypothetical protein [Cyanocohniella sp. LLY]
MFITKSQNNLFCNLLLIVFIFLVSCTSTSSPKEASTNNSSDSTSSNNNLSTKIYTDVVSEYKDAIKGDSDYTSLKNLADKEPETIRFYAKSYCEAKAKGFSDFEISQHLEEQAETVSNSFSDSDTAKRLLMKAQKYSIELGQKYYCK